MKPAPYIKVILTIIAITLTLIACHRPDHHDRRTGQPIVVK
jgi:hypothetical protein